MRRGVLSVCAVLCATTASAAAPEQGSYADALRTMLTGTAAGSCPADIMGDELLKACREQLPRLAPQLKAGGPIRSMTFVKAEQINGERFETYKVAFAQGEPSTWHIGGLHGTKFRSAYSNGD